MNMFIPRRQDIYSNSAEIAGYYVKYEPKFLAKFVDLTRIASVLYVDFQPRELFPALS